MLTLQADEVQVWYAYTDRCSAPELQQSYLSLLSPQERERHARFAFEHLKAEFLLTRALCRIMLSHYAAVDPAAWSFGQNAYGRPHLLGPQQGLGLSFNLSNTRSLVAMAVVRGMDEIGVDVEELQRRPAPINIADRYFSPHERAGLMGLRGAAQSQRFFDLWTLKEAYIKARGQGLSIPLDAFSMRLDNADIAVEFEPHMGQRGSDWQFALHHLQASHNLALCVRRPAAGAARICLHETVPRLEAVRPR
jgi:4'-phosphopantetheinyl transferase